MSNKHTSANRGSAGAPPKRSGNGFYRVSVLVVTVGATGISFFTTGLGLSSLLGKEWGMVQGALAGFACSAFLSTIIVAFWGNLFLQQGVRLAWPILAAGALAASIGSGLFASGGLRLATDFTAFQLKADRASASPVVTFVQAQSDSQAAIAGQFQSLSTNMSQLSLRETSRGDTCEGQQTQPVCGPRCRMRERINTESAANAATATQLSQEALDILVAVSAIRTDADWAGVWQRAARLSADPRMHVLAGWVATTLDNFNEGFVDLSTGQTFQCRDTGTVAKLETLSAALAGRPILATTPPPRPAVDFSSSAGESIRVAYQALLHLAGLGPAVADEDMRLSTVPFALAAFVETFVVLCLSLTALQHVQDQPRRRRTARLPRWLDDLTGQLPQEQAALVRAFYETVLACLVMEAGGRMFVQPLNGDPRLVGLAARAVEMLGLRRPTGPFAIHKLAPATAAVLRPRIDGLDQVNLWRVGGRASRRIRQLARLLGPTMDAP